TLAAAGLQPLAHGKDLFRQFRPPAQPVRSLLDDGHHLPTPLRSVDDASPRQGLSLPKLGSPLLVVAPELGQRDDKAARTSRGPQPHVDRVEPAHRSLVAGGTDNALGKLGEEVEVVGQVEAVEARGTKRWARAAIALVDQDQV